MFLEPVALPVGVQEGCITRSLKRPYSKAFARRSHLGDQQSNHSKNTSYSGANDFLSIEPERLLDNIGISAVHISEKTDEKTALDASEWVKYERNKLFELRRTVGVFYPVVRPCGHYPRKQGEDLGVVKGRSGSVYYTQLQQCKSRWACPVCSMKIAKRRADEVRNILTNAVVVDGHKAVMITLTLPHYSNDRLHYLVEHVQDAFRDITTDPKYKGQRRRKQGGGWTDASGGLKQEMGVKGFIKALEVKKSLENGWHPHLHVCFVLDASADTESFAKAFIRLWAAHILKRTGKRIKQKAQDWREITDINGISDYTSKWDVARELVESNRKNDGSGLPVFKLVELFQETGDIQFQKDFLTFANAMKNARPVSYSNDLKKTFLRGMEEKTEDEACEEEEIEVLLMSVCYEIFKELRKQRQEANLLNLGQFEPDSLVDFMKERVPGAVNVAAEGSPPRFKML